MKTLQITKVERDGDIFAVTFALGWNQYASDFDLQQLGNDILVLSSIEDQVMVSGEVTLQAGDSITDEIGGQPVIGVNRQAVIVKDMSIRKESDYRDSFRQKMSGQGER